LDEVIEETISWLAASSRPVILAGVEVARFGMSEKLLKFSEKTGIPVASSLLGKSVFPEMHPNYLGVYTGYDSVGKAIEESDCLIMLGVSIGDIVVPTNLSKKNVIVSTVGEVVVKNHTYNQVQFADFLQALFKVDITKKLGIVGDWPKSRVAFDCQHGAKITSDRLFAKINSILGQDVLVISDMGDAIFGSSQLMTNRDSFIGPSLYGTKGFAVAGGLGVYMAKKRKPLVIVGDGAFQASCQELGSYVRHGVPGIIVVLNNGGYATQKIMSHGLFNDVPRWQYHKLVDVFGGKGILVETEDQLDSAMNEAVNSNQLFVLNVIVEGISSALDRARKGRQ
jgi:indolepyruvate decarboxylase